ncbi:hypothetical protein Tco_1527169, partial [Tanacetum coccineum]
MSDSEQSTVSYTSISSDSDPSSWGIPLMDADELPKMDLYEESAATPPPPPPAYRTTSRISVQSKTPIPFPYEAEVARLLALTTPPPSSLTPVSSPLPQIPPPPTSPTYDQASLSSDIPEADILPQKRLILTNPTPRFEVGESSTTAAARQPRSTVAHRVDYSFLDTIDASIRASKRRTMAVIEVVNLRVSYQADLRRRESEEFYTR